MIKEVDISELHVGHFVVDIVKQENQFTLMQSGHIKSDLVIKNMVTKGVQSLLIDTSKTKRVKDNTTKNSKKSPIIMDVYKAKEIFDQSKSIQKKIFSDAQNGKPLDLNPVEEITDKTIDEIFKNPDALACVINIRNTDEYLLEHSVSVSVLITIFARFLKIEKPIVQQLSVGAFLHDVGKIMVPEKILNKPGKLTDNEFTTMKTHVNHSIEI